MKTPSWYYPKQIMPVLFPGFYLILPSIVEEIAMELVVHGVLLWGKRVLLNMLHIYRIFDINKH